MKTKPIRLTWGDIYWRNEPIMLSKKSKPNLEMTAYEVYLVDERITPYQYKNRKDYLKDVFSRKQSVSLGMKHLFWRDQEQKGKVLLH